MTQTESQMNLAAADRAAGETAIVDAVESVPSMPDGAAVFAAELARIIDRITPADRVRETQIAALVVNKFVPHMRGLSLKLEKEHGAGPMACKLIRRCIDAVGECGAQLNACARDAA